MATGIKMKLTIFCVIQLFLALLGTAQSQKHDHDNRDDPKFVTEAQKKMWNVAAELYKGAKELNFENVVFSPLSLTTLMVMLNAAANGETAEEIQSLFKIEARFVKNHSEILHSLTNQDFEDEDEDEDENDNNSDSAVKLLPATRIYANSQNAKLRKNYVSSVSSLGDVKTLDFTQPKPVVQKMNEWVNNQTEGKISKIVEEKDFDTETSLVLLNTLYFKAPWKQQFNSNDTKIANFHVSECKTVKVEMMYISADFPHAELNQVEASAVFLPYKGDRLSMIIYLPYKGTNVSPLEEKLKTLVPSEIRSNATTSEISLHLPKFNISSTLDFEQILINLGVGKMFKKGEADFKTMSESAQFHVSKVRQAVFIEVNEEGEAPVPAADVGGLLPPNTNTVIKVDRPFIFQIYDNVTGAVLLSGRISNPNEPANQPIVSDSWSWNWICDSLVEFFTTLNIIIVAVVTIIFIAVLVCVIRCVRARRYSERNLVPDAESEVVFSKEAEEDNKF